MSTIELKDGGVYKDRVGTTVKVRLVEPGGDFPFEGMDEPFRYMRDGRYMPSTGMAVNDFDLVEQVV